MVAESFSSETSSIWQIDPKLWKRGGFIRMPVKGSSFPWICRNPYSPLLIVFPTHRELSEFSHDWASLFCEDLPELREVPLDADSILDPAIYVQRGESLYRWKIHGGTMLATAGALVSPARRSSSLFQLNKGEEISRDHFISWIHDQGYHLSENVWSPGQYVIRGSIMDIFDPAYHYPVRLEFFDETLEQIRLFKPRTQKSIGSVDDLNLHGVRSSTSLFASMMFPENMHVLLYEPAAIEDQAENYIWLWRSLVENRSGFENQSWKDIYKILSGSPMLRITRIEKPPSPFYKEMKIYSCPHFKGRVNEFRLQCQKWLDQDHDISVYSTNERYLEFAREMGVRSFRKYLSRGFHDTHTNTVILSDMELAGLSTSPSDEKEIPFPMEWDGRLSQGDWVIHEDYGVALFSGLEIVNMDGSETDMFALEFAEEKRLLMPVTQFSKLSRLSVLPGTDVAPDSLGGKRWKKQVKRDREKAREEAEKLLQIYAEREILRGFAFSRDGEYLEQLEKSFPFSETADQLTAIRSVKADMERSTPMDRLVVGDVGYGKTEVAIRAAMKAVESGKQVAVLVPTTLLAQQHYNTFATRMSGFPVRTEVLSRFVKPTVVKKIKQEIELGKVDIIIGTQRLLQRDISFRDLGLLVVDEEHRFGVLNKEKIKDKHRSVDVLTLSATPIPRTLSMSLKGLKGISVISTPPENRMPVMTFVGPWREDIVIKAISREFNRGGQVFFVHNRVESIERKAAFLKSLFPDINIRVAHGQMNEKELEQNMLSFYGGDADMLVCTTIVESGLDVGRANTMVVDDAHELGLAQLYQLRGRIGRRDETGYAFFLYPDDKPLSPVAADRLEAIANLGTTGSGYSLSMQDLSIRGAGELVGTMQHGRSARLGIDYYYDLLEEEINRLRGIHFTEPEITLEMGVTIPSTYIPQEGVRISLYRRLLRVSSPDEIAEIRNEMTDRFGPVPGPVQYLLDLTLIRKIGSESGIISLSSSQSRTVIYYLPEKGLATRRGASGWIFSEDHAVGPGGIRGMSSLVLILRGYMYLRGRGENTGGDPGVGYRDQK